MTYLLILIPYFITAYLLLGSVFIIGTLRVNLKKKRLTMHWPDGFVKCLLLFIFLILIWPYILNDLD